MIAEHGTPRRYNHGPDENGTKGKGCRCDLCTAAQRANVYRYRHQRRTVGRGTVASGEARQALGLLRLYGWTAIAVGRHLGLGDPANILRSQRCTLAVHHGVLDLLREERFAAAMNMELRSRRIPVDPAVRVMEDRGIRSKAEQARAVGCHPRQWHRWLDYGITADRADDLAAALGYHPLEIWPDLYEMSAA